MKPNEAIVIERTANGFIVRDWAPPHHVVCVGEMLVFNEMGYASSPGDASLQPCLLKFIEQHFAEGKNEDQSK